MLNDLEENTDRTKGRLDTVMKRVDKLLEANGGDSSSLFCLSYLIVMNVHES